MDYTVIIDFVSSFALGNPKLAGACAIAYIIGLGSKIAREAIEKFVLESPSKKDDEALEKAKKNPAYKVISAVLDLAFRLKKPEGK